jgi:hypothetical protein
LTWQPFSLRGTDGATFACTFPTALRGENPHNVGKLLDGANYLRSSEKQAIRTLSQIF